MTKVKALENTSSPGEKTITINFTFKANDTSLKNNTQTLSVEVKLTHAQKFDNNKVETLIKNLGETLDFQFDHASMTDGLFSVNEAAAHDVEVTTDSFVTTLNTRIAIRKAVGYLKELKALDFIKVEVPTGGKNATFYYKLILEDKYETIYDNETTPLRFKLNIDKGAGKWVDNSTK